MKTLLIFIMVFCGLSSYCTETKPLHLTTAEEFKARKAEFDAMSTEEKRAFREKRIAFHKEKAGGILIDTRGMSGTIFVINAQTTISSDQIRLPVQWLQNFLKVQFKVVNGGYVRREKAYSFRQSHKANAIIVVYEDKSEPSSILVAPELRWASVNIARLGPDNLTDRTQKEISRAIAYVCGGMSSQYHPTLGSHVDSPSFLDCVEGYDLPVDILMSIRQFLPQLGVRPYREVIYRKACKEGWAPAPTNEYQKAIWDKVRSDKERGPTNPIEIPMPKKK